MKAILHKILVRLIDWLEGITDRLDDEPSKFQEFYNAGNIPEDVIDALYKGVSKEDIEEALKK